MASFFNSKKRWRQTEIFLTTRAVLGKIYNIGSNVSYPSPRRRDPLARVRYYSGLNEAEYANAPDQHCAKSSYVRERFCYHSVGISSHDYDGAAYDLEPELRRVARS